MASSVLAHWISTFFHDDKVLIVLFLIALDFVFGVAAAVKTKTFRLSYVANFARDDLLGKVIPYFAIYAAALVAGHTSMVIPGLDLGVVAGAVYVAVVAAMVGSILKSLADLGFKSSLVGA